MFYDLAIIGGGPAGAAATVYAGRKQLKTVVIAEEIGGQSAVSETIYNWIGTKEIGGDTLAHSLRQHMEEYTFEKAGEKGTVTLMVGKLAERVIKDGDIGFTLTLSDGSTIQTKSVLVCTGSRHRKLDVPGAIELDYKGIMYCATCDGPLFGDMEVAVVGGGNAAFEAVLQLTRYAKHVTLIHRNQNFRADPITIDMVKKDPKATIIANSEVTAVHGSMLVEKIEYKNLETDAVVELPVSAVFVEIGQIPNTDFVSELVNRTENKNIVVDPSNQRTNVAGLWAAGDCTDGRYHQNNIAAGDAVKAIEDIYIWLKTNK